MGGALRPGRQAAEPGLPLSPAGARLLEGRHVVLYDESLLFICQFNMFSASGVFGSTFTSFRRVGSKYLL